MFLIFYLKNRNKVTKHKIHDFNDIITKYNQIGRY